MFSHSPACEDVKEVPKKDEPAKETPAAPPNRKEVTEEELEDWLDSMIS